MFGCLIEQQIITLSHERIILNVLYFVPLIENNVDVVCLVMGLAHREQPRNESSVPSAVLWKLLNCLPLVAAFGSGISAIVSIGLRTMEQSTFPY